MLNLQVMTGKEGGRVKSRWKTNCMHIKAHTGAHVTSRNVTVRVVSRRAIRSLVGDRLRLKSSNRTGQMSRKVLKNRLLTVTPPFPPNTFYSLQHSKTVVWPFHILHF